MHIARAKVGLDMGLSIGEGAELSLRQTSSTSRSNAQNNKEFVGDHPAEDGRYAQDEKCARLCPTHEQAYYKTAGDVEEVAGRLPWECTFSICQHET